MAWADGVCLVIEGFAGMLVLGNDVLSKNEELDLLEEIKNESSKMKKENNSNLS